MGLRLPLGGPPFIETSCRGMAPLLHGGGDPRWESGFSPALNDRGATWEPHPDNPVFPAGPGLLGPGAAGAHGPPLVNDPLSHVVRRIPGAAGPGAYPHSPSGLATLPTESPGPGAPTTPVLGPGAPGSWNDLRVVSPHVTPGGGRVLLLFRPRARPPGRDREVSGGVGVWRPGAVGGPSLLSRWPVMLVHCGQAGNSRKAPPARRSHWKDGPHVSPNG